MGYAAGITSRVPSLASLTVFCSNVKNKVKASFSRAQSSIDVTDGIARAKLYADTLKEKASTLITSTTRNDQAIDWDETCFEHTDRASTTKELTSQCIKEWVDLTRQAKEKIWNQKRCLEATDLVHVNLSLEKGALTSQKEKTLKLAKILGIAAAASLFISGISLMTLVGIAAAISLAASGVFKLGESYIQYKMDRVDVAEELARYTGIEDKFTRIERQFKDKTAQENMQAKIGGDYPYHMDNQAEVRKTIREEFKRNLPELLKAYGLPELKPQ